MNACGRLRPPASVILTAMNSCCCIFVDGENLRNSIVDLFRPEFVARDYLPKNADWESFFDYLAESASHNANCERLRTYWYVIDNVDFYPYDLPNPSSPKKIDRLKRSICLDEGYKAELSQLDGDDLIERMTEVKIELRERQRVIRERFDWYKNVQDGIAQKNLGVEFRRAGGIRYDLFRQDLDKEKAVDVKLGVDLVVLSGIYDIAILLSGDQDYIPAVQVVKDAGKRVINVVFKMRNNKILPRGARRLNQITDDTIVVGYDILMGYLNLTQPQLPTA